MKKNTFINKSWFKVLYLTTISIYLYVFMEWIFFVTKPSFMSSMNFTQTVEIFLFSSLIMLAPGLLLTVFSILAGRLHKFFIWVSAGIPALVVAILSLTLVDNFTYTVFKFGIVTSEGVWRGVYAAALLACFVYFLRTFASQIQQDSKSRISPAHYFIFVFLAASILTVAFQIPTIHLGAAGSDASSRRSSELPNIILLGFDGVNAANMSVYGYERDTTPNITKLAKSALIVENAFSNSGNTGGSLTSILTGKLPTETRVVYPPDILTGEDAYQHLPGILKQLGYSTVQVTDTSFGDAYSRNIKDGFDVANFRSESTNPFLDQIGRFGGGGPYFSAIIIQRAAERIEHIFYIKTMVNPYEVVTNPVPAFSEDQRFNEMISSLKNADGPLFLHVHMLGTHGSKFKPSQNIFSAGETQDKSWMVDFYDDAILDADTRVKNLFKYLRNTGRIKNTIVILYSDHGMGWNPHNKVPLIIWFPNGQYAGKLRENAQLLDIAPTILDYLNVSQLAWMSGQSLLSNNLPPVRKIFSAETTSELVANIEGKGWSVDETKISPPYFQLGKVDLIVCNQWYSLNLLKPGLTYGKVTGSTVVCNESDVPSPEQAKKLILQQLADNHYDTSAYPQDIPIETDQPTDSASVDKSPSATETPSPTTSSIKWEYPTTGWAPLIAHGLGEWNGNRSPDNYEAFLESYEEGFRTFEVDVVMSKDGIPLAAHNLVEDRYGLEGVFSDYTAQEFLAAKYMGSGTTMAGPQIIQLLHDYPDIQIVLDIKGPNEASYISWFLDRLPESQWPRLLSNIRGEKQIQKLYAKYPTYRGLFLQIASWKEGLDWTDEQIRDMVIKNDLAGIFTWVNELDPNLDYIANNSAAKRWTPTLEKYMIKANKAMIWYTSDDSDLIALRRSHGGAIITNIAKPARPSRVLVISIDGFRPDAIFQAPMPNLMALMQTSAYTLNAQTIYPSSTLPSHTSMLTGLCPSQHGVDWNDYDPNRGFATGIDIFDLANAAGIDTYMVVGKMKLRQITEPESTDIFEFIDDGDDTIANRATELIARNFGLMFVHLPTPDSAGHNYGWLSPEQLDALQRSDEALGTILSTLDKYNARKNTLIVVTSDHGGHATTHGTNRPDDMTIPWIISGPGVVPMQLTTDVNTTDTAATIAWALNLDIPTEWDGRPVLEAFGNVDEPHITPRCP